MAVLLFIAPNVIGQKTDYLKIRDGVRQQICGVADSASVMARIERLEHLDTTAIDKNLDYYYVDLGTNYWLLTNGDGREEFLIKAQHANQRALALNPKNLTALWSMAIIYAISKECNHAESYFNLYQHYAPKKIWTAVAEEQRQILGNCKS